MDNMSEEEYKRRSESVLNDLEEHLGGNKFQQFKKIMLKSSYVEILISIDEDINDIDNNGSETFKRVFSMMNITSCCGLYYYTENMKRKLKNIFRTGDFEEKQNILKFLRYIFKGTYKASTFEKLKDNFYLM